MKKDQISEYINKLEAASLVKGSKLCDDVEITGITYDSRNVKPGNLFICKGFHFKEEYLIKAIENGAVAYVSENEFELSSSISSIIVSDIRLAMPVITGVYYGDLSEKIKVVGITGTKGKTTSTYFIKSILDDYLTRTSGLKCAVCSGIDNYDGVSLEESHLTTPEIFELYQHLDNAVNSNIPYMVMEVSSQALKYHRTAGVTFEIAAFLNIGLDHISDAEHADFEDYFGSKLAIFQLARKACINMDSDHFEQIEAHANACSSVVRFSEVNTHANVYSSNIISDQGRVEFDITIQGIDDYPDTHGHVKLATFGKVNVKNALAAVAIAATLGIPFENIQAGLSAALVPGRMEVYYSSDGKKLGIVDYAHNELSYRTMLSAISEEFPDKKLVLVFGSTGGKAFNRREELGTLAGKYCHHVVLTEDDGGTEDVASICKEIATYLGPDCSYDIVVDRPTAIRKALSEADENTIVIACGKAREHYQKRGDHYVEIESDVDVMKNSI